MLKDEEISKYTNELFTEQLIRNAEDHLLSIMKYRQENMPSERNDVEWLSYTNFVCARRCQRVANEENKNVER